MNRPHFLILTAFRQTYKRKAARKGSVSKCPLIYGVITGAGKQTGLSWYDVSNAADLTCMICNPPRSFQEYVARMQQTPEKASKQYEEIGRKLYAEYQAEKERKQHEISKAQNIETNCKAAE